MGWGRTLPSFPPLSSRARLLSFRAGTAFLPRSQAATSKPPRRSAPYGVQAQPGATAEVGLGRGEGERVGAEGLESARARAGGRLNGIRSV